MDREQKRKFKRKLKSKGLSDHQINLFILTKERELLSQTIPNGTKVKLRVDRIRSHPDYNKNIDYNKQRYHDFIDSYDGKIFTSELNPDKKDLVCLKEDPTRPKWLFWTGDLEVVKE